MNFRDMLLAKHLLGGGGSGGVVNICESTKPTKELVSGFSQVGKIRFPNAESIDGCAFYDCTSLTSVDLPVVTSIGDSAFYGCTALTIVDLPVATSIGGHAFYNCAFTSVNLPAATSVDVHAFQSCANLTSVDLPSATSIGSIAFDGCTSLTSVDLPVVTSIGDGAFGCCTSLTSVDLPVVTSIGDGAFLDCPALTSVDLPVVTSIGAGAFQRCTALDTLILRNTETVCELIANAVVGTKIVTAEGMPTGEGFIYVPAKFYEDYVTLLAYQAAMLLVSQGMGEAEAQATADYIARAILRKIEDYPEICG